MQTIFAFLSIDNSDREYNILVDNDTGKQLLFYQCHPKQEVKYLIPQIQGVVMLKVIPCSNIAN